MLRILRVIHSQVKFVPAPRLSIMQSPTQSGSRPPSARPSSSSTKTYAPQDLPAYDYDLVVIGGGSGGKEKKNKGS